MGHMLYILRALLLVVMFFYLVVMTTYETNTIVFNPLFPQSKLSRRKFTCLRSHRS